MVQILLTESNPNFADDDEKPPVNPFYTMLGWYTISKSKEWWICLVHVAQGSKQSVRFYAWQRNDSKESGWSNRLKQTATKWDWDGLSEAAKNFCAQCGA